MKPRTATTRAVALMLAVSAISLGLRHVADSRFENSKDQSRTVHLRGRAESGPGPTKMQDRPGRGPIEPDSLAKKLRSVLATGNRADRARAMLKLSEKFEAGDWPMALETLESLGGAHSESQLLLSAWSEIDPAKAMVWAEPKGSFSTVIWTWAAKEPEGLLAYLFSPDRTTKPGSWGAEFSRSIEALANDLPHLFQLINQLPEKNRTMILEQARPNLDKVSDVERRTWIESIDPALRKPVLKMVLRNLTGVDHRLALVEEHPDDLGPESYSSIYSEWTKSDPAAAVASVDELEPGPMLRPAVWGTIIGLSQNGAMEDAVELARRYSDEADDQLLQEMMNHSTGEDAPLLIGEIPRVKNPDRRNYLYKLILNQWLRFDPPAAKSWLSENEIPEQVRRELDERK